MGPESGAGFMTRVGLRISELRRDRELPLLDLALRAGVGFTVLSKLECGQIHFGDYPKESLIRRFAKAVEGDKDELPLVAEKIHEHIQRRMVQRPEVFRMLPVRDGAVLDRVLEQVDQEGTRREFWSPKAT
jgi:transcriptional regulator with XRE-family HTH domain